MSGLTELGQLLHEEHFRILVSICGLENRINGPTAADPLDPCRAEDQQQLEDLISALDEVLSHHAFEEAVIFPLIRGGGGGELTSTLAREHGAIEPMAARLRAIASHILEKGAEGKWVVFREAAARLIAEVMRHLQKEELNIVRGMECFLDGETDHRLAIQFLAHRGNCNFAGSAAPRSGPEAGRPVAGRRLSPVAVAARNAARRRSTSPRQPSR
jgi:hemerythrin-like domain-containing protein